MFFRFQLFDVFLFSRIFLFGKSIIVSSQLVHSSTKDQPNLYPTIIHLWSINLESSSSILHLFLALYIPHSKVYSYWSKLKRVVHPSELKQSLVCCCQPSGGLNFDYDDINWGQSVRADQSPTSWSWQTIVQPVNDIRQTHWFSNQSHWRLCISHWQGRCLLGVRSRSTCVFSRCPSAADQ